LIFDKVLSMKDVRSHGQRRGMSRADIFRTTGRGSSDADTRTFWYKKG